MRPPQSRLPVARQLFSDEIEINEDQPIISGSYNNPIIVNSDSDSSDEEIVRSRYFDNRARFRKLCILTRFKCLHDRIQEDLDFSARGTDFMAMWKLDDWYDTQSEYE